MNDESSNSQYPPGLEHTINLGVHQSVDQLEFTLRLTKRVASTLPIPTKIAGKLEILVPPQNEDQD